MLFQYLVNRQVQFLFMFYQFDQSNAQSGFQPYGPHHPYGPLRKLDLSDRLLIERTFLENINQYCLHFWIIFNNSSFSDSFNNVFVMK